MVFNDKRLCNYLHSCGRESDEVITRLARRSLSIGPRLPNVQKSADLSNVSASLQDLGGDCNVALAEIQYDIQIYAFAGA